MSAGLAIPATTFVLKGLLEARLKKAYGALTVPPVSLAPPPRPPAPAAGPPPSEPAGLILFMHHAVTNPAWLNMYDPHVDSLGARVANAPLVLDLHYMLAAQGQDLEREALLGIGMSAFHRNGVIPRKLVHDILTSISIPPSPSKLVDSLPGEPLDDPANQPESITISRQALDIDMSTKLWSALHSPLRPCAFYLVTTVFLDTGEIYPAGKAVKKINLSDRPSIDQDADPAGDETVVIDRPLP